MSSPNSQPPSHPPQPGAVRRQIELPLRTAVDIAYKNIRMRLSRSLLVTSGIILALAFLMSIRANEAMIDGLRGWMATFNASPEFEALRRQRQTMEQEIKPLENEIRADVRAAAAAEADGGEEKPKSKKGKGKPKFDFEKHFGKELSDLQKEFAALPAAGGDLDVALAADAGLIPKFQRWIDSRRQIDQVKNELTSPQRLSAMMEAEGVPTTPEAIAGSRIQTRWLLGLALLVAFVGILNAMLMSVTERFREIGTMKCLGALDGFIIKLFLLESLFQGIVGTLAGIIVGLLLSFAGTYATYGRYAWRNIPTSDILSSVGICLLVGIGLTVAGAVYPAWQAARMQPIEAMRVET